MGTAPIHAAVLIVVAGAAAAIVWRFGRKPTPSAVAEAAILLAVLAGLFVLALPASQCGRIRVTPVLLSDVAVPLLAGCTVFALVHRTLIRVSFLAASFFVASHLAFQACHIR